MRARIVRVDQMAAWLKSRIEETVPAQFSPESVPDQQIGARQAYEQTLTRLYALATWVDVSEAVEEAG